jgi:hypothetical protein
MDTLLLKKYITKTILGYHLINDTPIKEAVWETILCCALNKANYNYDYKQGSHCSGRDIVVKLNDVDIGISCKSCKETRTSLVLSSYRLTTCKKVEDFVNEIDIKRANFDYYSIISRYDGDETTIYSIYLIPAEIIKSVDKEWIVKYKKNTKGNDNVISQWETIQKNGLQLSVKASMSNQLWITLNKQNFKKYCLCDNIVVKNKKVIDYCVLFDKLSLEDVEGSS